MFKIVLKSCRPFIFVAMSFVSFSIHAEDVSVLVLYTQAAVNTLAGGAIDDKVNAYIDASNDSYIASGIDINLTLAAARLVPNVDDTLEPGSGAQNYSTNDALYDLQKGVAPFNDVPNLRNTFGADIVVLLRDMQDTGGLGFVDSSGNFANWAYSVVRIKNPLSSFTHEVGHNMGLIHSRRQGGKGITHYAAGHGIDRVDTTENGFVTIMAYTSAFNWAPRLDLMSNPDIDCDSGTSIHPCGVDENDLTNGANSARVLNDRKTVYSAYRIAPAVKSVTFSDINLSTCLTPSQNVLIPNFTNLNCASENINSISGVESLTGLTYANFQNNNIFNFQPLFNLPNLQSVVVSGNDNAICGHLTQLEEKLGSTNVIRSSDCFPLTAVHLSVTDFLL